MKTILIILVLVDAFLGEGCSRSDKEKQPDATVQTTANSNLRADAERLQKATAKAAEERRRAHESATPGTPATPKP